MLMSFVFVPFYLKMLGVEAYGVIGFFASLAAIFSFLDLGLTTTLNRELARRSALSDEVGSMRTVVHTLEIVYVSIGVGVALIVMILAQPIADYWLNAKVLSNGEIVNAIRMMGLVIAFEWPTGLYLGGLAGLQRQVLGNVLYSGMMTARGVGAILVLLFIHRSVTAYFMWQVVVSASGMVLVRTCLLSGLPRSAARWFDRTVLAFVWRFAAGMTGLALLTIVLMQADKVVLSATLLLSDYAHYLLAYSIAGAAGFMGIPIFNAVFPEFTAILASGDRSALRTVFHRQAQLMSVVIAPTVLVVMMFAQELMVFWTRDVALADTVAPLARVLAFGTAINSLMLIPYALTLANGKPIYSIVSNIVGVIVIVPLVLFLAKNYGAYGAAFAWPILNFGYFLSVPIVLRSFMPGSIVSWYLVDVARPFSAAAIVVALVRWVAPAGLSASMGFIVAGVAGAVGLLAAGSQTSAGRAVFGVVILRARRARLVPGGDLAG